MNTRLAYNPFPQVQLETIPGTAGDHKREAPGRTGLGYMQAGKLVLSLYNFLYMFMRRLEKKVIWCGIICLWLIPFISNAQGDGGGGDPDTPIDGGLGILVAAGAAYGYKRLKAIRNKPG